ncbi:MAG: glycosidase, partial [Acidobacteria bacterium]
LTLIRQFRLIIFLALAVAATAGPASTKLPFGPWSRVSNDPIISPQGDGFESAGTFNPTVIKNDGKFVMLYRAQDRKGTSSLGYATSDDGIHFVRRPEPVMVAETPYEKGGGVEDLRLVKIGDIFYLTYTGYNNVTGTGPQHGDAQLCMATSTDLTHWKRLGVIMPAYKGKWNVGWTKSGAILPEKVGGKYWMYYLADGRGQLTQMSIAYSTDLVHWTEALDHPVVASRPNTFDSTVVEPGPAPFMTEQGIFLIYNGADDKSVYRTGWVIFDKQDPTKVVARANEPIFGPGPEWEKVGQVPNVVFVEGLAREGKKWLFYYGGADKYVGVASAPPL